MEHDTDLKPLLRQKVEWEWRQISGCDLQEDNWHFYMIYKKKNM